MDILEDNELTVEEEQTISFLQTTLGIAQTRLNEMLIKSINDEARLRQTINNLQIEIDQLKSEDDGSQEVDSSNNGRSQITTR